MSKDEAIQLLGGELDYIDDFFEEQVFQLKNQIIQSLSIKKLIVPKLKKINFLFNAYELLIGEVISENIEEFNFNLDSDSILNTVTTYQLLRNKLKLILLNAQSFHKIEYASNSLINLELQYANKWFEDTNLPNDILVSKVIDPMELLFDIKLYASAGGHTFDDLKKGKNYAPKSLIVEKNRLSLLLSKYS